MKSRKITLSEIFLDILSKSDDKGTKLAAERIKAAIKSPEISELLNEMYVLSILWDLGPTIKSKTVDNAVETMISPIYAVSQARNSLKISGQASKTLLRKMI